MIPDAAISIINTMKKRVLVVVTGRSIPKQYRKTDVKGQLCTLHNMAAVDLDMSRATAMKLIGEYRGEDKSPIRTIRRVLEMGGEYGWASTLVVSTYGVRLGAFLLETTTDVFALAGCCIAAKKDATVEYEGLNFALDSTPESKTPAPELFVRTGLPLDFAQVICTRRTDGLWELFTVAYVHSETLKESAGLDLKRETVDSTALLPMVDKYLADQYELVDGDGCDWTRDELVEALKTQ